MAEVLQRALDPNPDWLQDWTSRLQAAADCSDMGSLMLQAEEHITGTRKSKQSQKALAENAQAADAEGGEDTSSGQVKQEGEGAGAEAGSSQWLKEGSDYIGKKVRAPN